MSYPFVFANKEYQFPDYAVTKEYYNKLLKKCVFNTSKSSMIYFKDGGCKKVCLIDGKLYSGVKNETDYWHEIVDEELVDYVEDEEEEEEEEKEYEYTGYGLTKSLWDGGGRLRVIINVAGGGMMNGNAYANIEGEWKTEDDFDNGDEGEIYYCEYGTYACRKYVGKRIIWGEDDNFNIE